MNLYKEKKGYVAIMVVLMIMAVGSMLASIISLVGVGELQSALALSKGENTLSFVEGCAEDALLKIWMSENYAGGNITRPEGTCSIIAATSTNVWTLTVTTTNTDYKRTVKVVGTRGATNFTVSQWSEI